MELLPLDELVSKYPITRNFVRHTSLSFPQITNISRVDAVISLLDSESPNEVIIRKLLDGCDITHLSYIVGRNGKIVMEWFVDSYHSDLIHVGDFFDAWREREHRSSILKPDRDAVLEYVSRVITKDNECLIYASVPRECSIPVLVRYCSDDIFKYKAKGSYGDIDVLHACMYSISGLLTEAYSVSEEKLFHIIDLLLSLTSTHTVCDLYINCLVIQVPNINIRGLLTAISNHYGVTRDDVLSSCHDIEEREQAERMLDDLFTDDV